MNFWVNYTLNNKGRRTISACKEFKHKTITASPKGSAQVRNRPDCTKVFKSSSKMTHTTQSVQLVYEGTNSPFGATLILNKHNEAEHNA